MLLLAAGLVGFGAAPAHAAPPSCAALSTTTAAAFFEGEMPKRLRSSGTPGAVVSVVSGTTVAYTHGFGHADVAAGTQMNPERTLVRIASITKLFTATAVMQQVEAGRLDLDADVNTLLTTFQIPRTYPQPIRVRDLINHTAGFEDRIIGTGARTADDVVPLGEYLAKNVPARIRPPGVVSAYSNYGAALAGYLVTKATGEPWDTYVQQHLLTPLGMTHSTASEPLPAALAADLANSYDEDGTRVPFTFDLLAPDGSVSATASDMAKFMIAHLNHGEGILKPQTSTVMQNRSFSADPRVGGYAHGFMDRVLHGHRVLMHGGDWEGFESVLLLVPDCRLGLFVSLNSLEGAGMLSEVVDGFLDRFAPGSEPAASGSQQPVVPQAGFYAPTRRNVTGIEKLLTLLELERLTVTDSGTLRFKNKTWTPEGDGAYRAGDDHLVAVDDGQYVVTDGSAFERASRADTLPFNLVVLAGFAVVALSALVVPVAAVAHRIRGQAAGARSWRLSRAMATLAVLLGLGFLAGLTTALLGSTSAFLAGPPAGLRALLAVPIVVFALGLAAAGTSVAGWRQAGVAARVHQAVLLAGIAAMAWFCWHWNLIGWQFS
ncbi:beta-lactamase family protein [Dactylosporangium vinaceum]|uniref:Serine hydrolase domain-containing protein n=1 Tax=Dactylosporangium vinaceum TaxID=53362 RepID=A0ABV5M3H2_9ACTN|nr:serine hydrolase domain-containing protein [Dactylosporangium vinaceum]UAB99673.1 beta-lactamase family protein [Dactylosporangium vinaceum]